MNKDTKLNVIITGTTGMVGEGVLQVCLNDDRVEKILVINRKTCSVLHPKLKEIIIPDFFDLNSIENELQGYNACFFCLGITSVRTTEEEYTKTTYALTTQMASVFLKHNPDMAFSYISGAGTTGNEHSNIMWIRVKSKTENALIKMSFVQEFNFRPGFMKAFEGAKNMQKVYKYINWLYPICRKLFKGSFITLEELGKAMINACYLNENRKNFNGKDIIELARL